MFKLIKQWLSPGAGQKGVVLDTLGSGDVSAPKVLIISAEKKNQNYYRDRELARQTRALFLSDNYPWADCDYSVQRVIDTHFRNEQPDWIFFNYNHGYSWRLHDLGTLSCPVLGFVGDHYDFIDDAPRSQVKQEFFRGLKNLAAMVTAYPHTNESVADAMRWPNLPFIYLPWAIDPETFRDFGSRRKYDIACLGALTEGKYPLRRSVRTWIEEESGLRYIRKKRIGGHDGEQFNAALNTTWSAFTCASAMRYTLMKYFEIPAAGTLMFGEETPELQALGFRDGEHYVAVSAENFADRIRYFTSQAGRNEGERIRLQGRDFVVQQHNWKKRITAFLPDVAQVLP